MCGFVGAVSLESARRVNDKLVQDVRAGVGAIGYRGPDASCVVSNESYVLGHCRLSIIGLGAAGHQPAVAADGAALVFNGEIYNFRTLADKYALGRRGDITSDTQVLFTLLQTHGERVIAELDGMFAFAYRDRSGRVLLARDRFGIKPLYYFIDNGMLHFSSERRGFQGKTLPVDMESVQAYLRSGSYPAGEGRTFFADVSQVEAGQICLFSLNAKNPECRSYISPLNSVVPDGAGDNVAGMLERIRDKISVSDVPICFSLSGGVDSCLGLATFARGPGRTGEQIQAITCRPFSAEFSEEAAATSTAEKLGVRLHVCEPPEMRSEEMILEHLRRLTGVLEAPVRSPGIFMQEAVYRHARQLGFKVIIDGEGADDLMGAYYGSMSSTLIDVWRERGALYGSREAHQLAQRSGMRLSRLMAKCAYQYVLQRTSFGNTRRQEPFRSSEINDLVTRASLPTLVHWGDRLSMRYSVEARPFYLFQEFLDWSKGLRASEALVGGYNKWPLRAILANHYGLSDVAFNTRKYGYSTTADAFSGVARIPSADPAWRDFVVETFAGKRAVKRARVDFRALGVYLFLKDYGAL